MSYAFTLDGSTFETLPEQSMDLVLIERLITYYKKQIGDQGPLWSLSPVWSLIIGNFHKDLDSALRDGDVSRVYRNLVDTCKGMGPFGLEIGDGADRPYLTNRWSFVLQSLANAVGALPCFNPEQPEQEMQSLEEILERVEDRLRHRLSYDGNGGLFGVRVGSRFININLLMGELDAVVSKPKGICLEIGSGFGMTALAALKRREVAKYHIVDIPIIAVRLAFFVASALPSLRLWLQGEPPFPGARLLVHGVLMPGVSVDWALNKDSLPEMPGNIGEGYLRGIEKDLSQGGQFHSINHESAQDGQIAVAHMAGVFERLQRTLRVPFWGRAGYVHEIWS